MALLTILDRVALNIVILDCKGILALGDGSTMLREKIREVVVAKGCKHVLLNLSKLSYMDSGGVGEMVSGAAMARNIGGTVKILLSPADSGAAAKIREIFQITKLYTYFEAYNDEATALRSFGVAGLFRRCTCPICGTVTMPPWGEGEPYWPEQTCLECGAEFTLQYISESFESAGVKQLTVEGEWRRPYSLIWGPPFTVKFPARLTLFSTHALQKLWAAIPKPRRVVFDLQQVTEVEFRGLEVVMSLLLDPEQGARVSASLYGVSPHVANQFPNWPPCFSDYSAAVEALGDHSDARPLLVPITKS